MESNYGYIIGTEPSDNIWKEGNVIVLKDNSTITCYEGSQSESDENVVIIGNGQAFREWLTPQININE